MCPDHEQVFAYTRTLGTVQATVLLNFAQQDISYSLDESRRGTRFILGNYSDDPETQELSSGKVLLRAYEGRVYVS